MTTTEVSSRHIPLEPSPGVTKSGRTGRSCLKASQLQAEILRVAVVGNEEWAEWIWQGTKEDGTPLEERGVSIFGIRDGRIAWARLYLEETEREGAGITETVRRITGREDLQS